MQAPRSAGEVKAELSGTAAIAAPSAVAVDPTALLQSAGSPPPAAAAKRTSGAAVAADIAADSTEGQPLAWQTAADRTIRMRMIEQIVRLLQRRKPGALPEWIAKLPEMARRLEDRLYRIAPSREEYTCTETLQRRLRDMAMKMGAKASRAQQHKRKSGTRPRTALLKAIREAAKAGQIRQHPKEGPVVVISINGETQMVPISRLPGGQQEKVYEMYKEHRARQQQRANRPSVFGGSVSSSGSGSGGSSSSSREANPPPAPSGGAWSRESGAAGGGGYDAQPQAKRVKQRQSGGGASPSTSKAPPRNTGEHRKAIVRQQQQRLLLLRHASKCQEKRGKCKATALCPQMKELWLHIAHCKNQHCVHPHCVSSRYVLSHYHRCKERDCEVCAPVRLAIDKQNEQHRSVKKQRKGSKSGRGKAAKIGTTAKGVVSAGIIKIADQANPAAAELKKKRKAKIPSQQSLTDTWTHNTIHAHLENLNRLFNPYYTKAVLTDAMLPLLKKLTEAENGWVFSKPVDPLQLQLSDYFDIIKHPMDLGTVRKNLEGGKKYKLPKAVAADIHLCFNNAMVYNPQGTEVYNLAERLLRTFNADFARVEAELQERERAQRAHENSCKLCGGEMFQFEPPVFYCSGMCGILRIRRNSYYYVDPGNKAHYCVACYGKLGDSIQVGESTVFKAELMKKKNDDMTEESWVQVRPNRRRKRRLSQPRFSLLLF